jgi:cytidyltransferase-like protein
MTEKFKPFKLKEKAVAVSGYFDPIHVGHLEMLEMAKSLGDRLIVIVNNDELLLSIMTNRQSLKKASRS